MKPDTSKLLSDLAVSSLIDLVSAIGTNWVGAPLARLICVFDRGGLLCSLLLGGGISLASSAHLLLYAHAHTEYK